MNQHPWCCQRPLFGECGAGFTPAPHVRATKKGVARGFTILEVLIVSAIVISLSGILLEASTAALNVATTINGQGIVQFQLAAATQAFDRDARLAMSAPGTCCNPPTYIQDLRSDDGNQRATLILRIPSIDSSGAALSTFDDVVYDFNAATGVLQRIVDANNTPPSSRIDGSRVVARNLTRVTFTLDNPAAAKEVTVQWSARRTEGRRAFDATVTSRIRFRNVS